MAVLEGVFSREIEIGKAEPLAPQKGIIRDHGAILCGEIAAAPAEFGGMRFGIRELHAAAFAERLDAVHLAAFDRDAAIVPQRGAAIRRHFALAEIEPLHVPKGVA